MNLKNKLIVSGMAATIIPMLIIVAIAVWQANQAENIAADEVQRMARENNEGIVEGIVAMVTSQQEVLEQKVVSDLNVARDVLRRTGRVSFSEDTINWQAVNQFTRERSNISLPRMMSGAVWLGQNSDPDRYSPVVDQVRDLVGGTCTIFQRMNRAGDMLRVSTNVETLDGQRAIGTYIPAVNPDGRPNPVLQRVLAGERFIGRAFVVNAWYVTAYEPIMDQAGDVVGVLYVGVPEESAESLRRQIMDIVVGSTGYVFVIDSSGEYIISRQGRNDGESVWETRDADGRLFIQDIVGKALSLKHGEFGEERYSWQNPGETQARMRTVNFAYFAPWDWIIAAGTFDQEIFQGVEVIRSANSQARTVMIIVFLVTLALIVPLWIIMSGGITKPLNRLMKYAESVADGDLSARSDISRKDEIGKLNHSIEKMVANLAEKMEESEQQTELARQESQKAKVATEEANQAREKAESAKSEGMLDAASQLEGIVSRISSASEELSAQVEQSSRGADEQKSRTSETATAMEEMNATVLEVAKNASSAASGADQAKDEAEEGSKVVADSIRAIQQVQAMSASVKDSLDDLGRQAVEIDKIMNVIDDIADQTNLLALNAAIEAARAGDAGRGFAVVADEVRKLAEKTMNATKEVSDAVTSIQQGAKSNIQGMDKAVKAVEEATQLAQKSGQALERIVNLVQEVADQVRSIATATEEQSSASEEVNRSIEDINRISAETADVMEQSSRAISELAQQAAELQGLIDQLKKA